MSKTVIDVTSCSICPAVFEAGQYEVSCGWYDIVLDLSGIDDFDPNTQIPGKCPARELSPVIELRFGEKTPTEESSSATGRQVGHDR